MMVISEFAMFRSEAGKLGACVVLAAVSGLDVAESDQEGFNRLPGRPFETVGVLAAGRVLHSRGSEVSRSLRSSTGASAFRRWRIPACTWVA